ncbi:MAG: acylphosphatase [Gammaproteobacteria bacterium]|jgi:acylphosphatase
MSSETIRGRVSGRVQRVSYRASLKREADRLGVTGWVRNLGDGRVEFLASGPTEAVQNLLDWARRGPPFARVDAVATERCDEPAPGGFEVRY